MAPAGKTTEKGTGNCGGIAISSLQYSGAQERCTVGAFKETDGTPNRADKYSSVNMGSPKGREFYGEE